MPGKSGAEARRAMATAALELFQERGYDDVSAAEIAARAGVTERTFFRHFAGKREALFDGEAALREALLDAVDAVPAGTPPLETLLRALDAVVPLLEGNRGFAEPRQAIVERTPALAEREAAKLATLTGVLAQALRERGTDEPAATVVAHVAMGVFVQATLAWLADPEPALPERMSLAAQALSGLIAEGGGRR